MLLVPLKHTTTAASTAEAEACMLYGADAWPLMRKPRATAGRVHIMYEAVAARARSRRRRALLYCSFYTVSPSRASFAIA